MVHREALKKVPGGKTIKIEVEIVNNVFKRVMISGDFFAYPPSMIEDIESELKGKGAKLKTIKRVLDKFKDKGELIGFSFKDLEELFQKVISN